MLTATIDATPVNGLVLLPFLVIGIGLLLWVVFGNSYDSNDALDPKDETDRLPAMKHALTTRPRPTYQWSIKYDAAPGLDAVRFHQDGHLIGEVLVENGEAKPFLAQLCAVPVP